MSRIAPTYSDFISQYDIFEDIDQTKIEFEINLSSRLLSLSTWGDFFSDAIGLDVAHKLTLSAIVGIDPKGGAQAAIGPITSVSAAGVSTSFGQISTKEGSYSDQYYQKTIYGQNFLLLQSQVCSMGSLCA